MYHPRLITPFVLELWKHFPAVAIVGARQVGKSTLLTQFIAPQAEQIVFDPGIDVRNAKADPELFLKSLTPPVILDEIQYAPEVIPVLKRVIDQDRKPGQFLISGSQQWQVMKHLSESLAGRVSIVTLQHFSLAELLGDTFSPPWFSAYLDDPDHFIKTLARQKSQRVNLFEVLWRGFFPGILDLPNRLLPNFYHSYLSTYIERDIRMMTQIENITLFSRFLRLLTALTAQEINYSQLGRDIGITPQTSQRWLELFKGTFQCYELPAYSTNLVKRVSGRPKLHFSDTGLILAAQSISDPSVLASHPIWGQIFETAVVNEFKKQIEAVGLSPQLYHWRLHSGAEVDLVIEHNGRLFPIEVKSKSNPGGHDAKGLKAFREQYQKKVSIAPGLIIAPVESPYPISQSDWVVPWDLLIEKK